MPKNIHHICDEITPSLSLSLSIFHTHLFLNHKTSTSKHIKIHYSLQIYAAVLVHMAAAAVFYMHHYGYYPTHTHHHISHSFPLTARPFERVLGSLVWSRHLGGFISSTDEGLGRVLRVEGWWILPGTGSSRPAPLSWPLEGRQTRPVLCGIL